MEVQLLEVREGVQEFKHVARCMEAHLKEQQSLDTFEHSRICVPCILCERTPPQPAERKSVHPRMHAQGTGNLRGGIHPPIVFHRTVVRVNTRVLCADSQLAHAAGDGVVVLEKDRELSAGRLGG